jgi:hypothetical protein
MLVEDDHAVGGSAVTPARTIIWAAILGLIWIWLVGGPQPESKHLPRWPLTPYDQSRIG